MQKSMPWIIALAALSGTRLLAQDITGTWQGTLQAGRELRTVIKISKADGGGLKGVLYSIDQGGQGIPINPITLQGSTVKMAMPGIGGSYEGKLDADGVFLTGTWTQGDKPLHLDLKHVTDATAWVIPAPPAPLKPMAADANPVFEVATIKPSRPEAQGRGFLIRGRQFSTINTSLGALIAFAYGVHARQIIGGPAWMESDKYDITAKPDGEGQPSEKQWKTMLQKLLADRFQAQIPQRKERADCVCDRRREKWTEAHQERGRSERSSRSVLQGTWSVDRQECEYGGPCPTVPGRGARSARGGSDRDQGKVSISS